MPRLALIAAVAENGCIGIDNKLPWHLPADLQYFKRLTSGGVVIMGRKTYESIGRPLPNRTNIVISRNPDFSAPGVRTVATLDEAIALGESIALINGNEDLFVIGGAQIYALALPRAQRLYLTEVGKTVTGDAFFPSIDRTDWREVAGESHVNEPDGLRYRFAVYERTH